MAMAMAMAAPICSQMDSTIHSNNNSSNNGRLLAPHHHLYINKSHHSWLVKTESNVRKEVKKKPNPPCVVCNGTGRVDCCDCSGRGRTNQVHLAMLPKGEWPKWCKICRGSGLDYCSRCLGDGKYREPMGFRFMKMDSVNDARSHKNKSVD